MGKNADYVAKMETQLKQWDAEVDALAAQGEKAGAQARAGYLEQVKAMRANRDAAQKTLREMRAAGEAAGAQMQVGMEAAWKTMQKSLEKASTELRI